MRKRRRKLKIDPARPEGADDPDSVELAPIPGLTAPAAADAPEAAPLPGTPLPGAAARRLRTGATDGNLVTSDRWKGLPRDLIDGYRLDALMGEGSMGAVFRAEQLSLHRPVAIKLLTPHRATDEKHLQRFLREARAVAKLNHPNIVSGIDVGESRGYRYFVMEFVEGPTLLQILETKGPLDGRSAAKVFFQIASALEHAHRNGLVHRDVKPANIVITARGGQAKLCDLGLAKEVGDDGAETMEGRAIGTPYYISPEQARGQADIDIRSDLYSLGASWFHAVTGEPPFDGPTPAVVMAKHLTEDPPLVSEYRSDLPPGTADVIDKLLSKDRAERYQTPAELVADIKMILEGSWGPAKPQIRARRRRRRFR